MEWRTARRPVMLPAGFTEPCNPTVSERPPSGPYWFMKSSTRLPDDRPAAVPPFDCLRSWILIAFGRDPLPPRVQRYFAAMLEDATFWIAIAVTVAGLVAVAVSIARG
jgi:hypothetical protein